MMKQAADRYEWARFLVVKLERLSADSVWAHRASGLRGALLRAIDEFDRSSAHPDELGSESEVELDRLISAGFDILEKAAKEIPDPQDRQV